MKKIILSVLMLGVMLMVVGSVSAYNSQLILENKDSGWQPMTGDNIQATLDYNSVSPTFEFHLTASGLTPETEYSLIYYADKPNRFVNWGGDNPGEEIVKVISDSSGNLEYEGSKNLGVNLPNAPDANIDPVADLGADYCDNHNSYDDYVHCSGAKIWLVPTDALPNPYPGDGDWAFWQASGILFETDLITYVEGTCELTIDPFAGSYNDGEAYFDSEAVPITWSLSEICTPIDWFEIWYEKDGNCDADEGDWHNVPGAEHLASGDVDTGTRTYAYSWNKPEYSGEYCVKIKVSSNGARDVSEVFNVDLAPPEISLDVQTPQIGDCEDDEEGTSEECYVSQLTQIKLSCSDAGYPWQSGYDYKQYRYRVYDEDTLTWGSWTEWVEANSFYFPGDSRHELEYRCYDHVGKVDTETKTFIVDTQAPIIWKTVGEPKIVAYEEFDWFINTDTEVCVYAEDPEPHPVNDVELWCEWFWWDDYQNKGGIEPLLVDNCFTFTEDSYHELHCWAEDALKNRVDFYEWDIVDSQAPDSWLEFEGPYYQEEGMQWIDTESRVVLTAIDPEPHPVGDVETYYRYGVINNDYCYGYQSQYLEGDVDWEIDWNIYEIPFGLPESCHVIEYYSVDALGNPEDVQVEFVFSDHTAPEPIKDVGKPSHKCEGFWEELNPQCEGTDWDWIVTMQTPITLSCDDVGVHPSGIKEICYQISWDGEILEGWRCVPYDQVPPKGLDIYFNQECEHTLEFYCVDNVEKTAYHELEVFKVKGESFEIDLDKKWNLISVPFNLLSTDVSEVFSDVAEDIESVWSYENGEWKYYDPDDYEGSTLCTIVPGRGYWVKTNSDALLLIGGELLSEGPVLPPSIPVDEGWNLIGHYGLMPKQSYCSLFSLVDTTIGHPRWSALYSYDAQLDVFDALDSDDFTNPGEGYWIEMDVEDNYSPATTCWGGLIGPP